MDKLVLNKIEKENNKVKYIYSYEGIWNKFLEEEKYMWIEYEFNTEKIPDSILAIPFLANFLPISWVFNLTIEINKLDSEFYKAMPKIKSGYKEMYKELKLKGNIKIGKTEENHYNSKGNCILYSGGVDAINTLINNIKLKPKLVTIWGADIKTDNNDAWNLVEKTNKYVANSFNLSFEIIKSNFRECIKCKEIEYVINKNGKKYGWWHDFQHGIALICLTSPLAFYYKYKKIFIASSFTEEYKGMYHCASDPTIDNRVKFASCTTSHDGYEQDRIDKLQNICNYSKKNNKKIKLRVCWKSNDGDNCCECEKCQRTILGLLSIKESPNNYGFDYSNEQYNLITKKYKKLMKYSPDNSYSNVYRYLPIQKAFIKNYKSEDLPKGLEKITKIRIHTHTPKLIIFYNKSKTIIKKILRKLFKKKVTNNV